MLLGSRFFANPKARAVIHRERQQPAIMQHRHNFFEIAIVTGGTGDHLTDGFRHRLKVGDVLLIHCSRSHGYARTRSLSLINVLIRNDVLARIGLEMKDLPAFEFLFATEQPDLPPRGGKKARAYPNRLRLNTAELEQMEDLATRIEEETRRGHDSSFLLGEAYLTLMVGLLVRSFERGRAATQRQPEGRFARVLAWIDANLAKPLMVSDMARIAGMSERTFYRKFRATLSMSPLDYLLQARIRHAKEQLVLEDSRIAEAALACGFEDSNYFARCFRGRTGKSPRAFRSDALAKAALSQ